MSAFGQKRTSVHVRVMSALPLKADIETQPGNVRFVPRADINSRYVCAATGADARHYSIVYSGDHGCVNGWGAVLMRRRKERSTIELGMKVSVRRSAQQRIGVVTRVEGDYVVVRWINSDLGETAEYQAHRDEVTPLAGWL